MRVDPRTYDQTTDRVHPLLLKKYQERAGWYLSEQPTLVDFYDKFERSPDLPIVSSYIGKDTIIVPGKGQRPKDCGVKLQKFVCLKCGKPHFSDAMCKNRLCPTCYNYWRDERTKRIFTRVFGYRMHHNNLVRYNQKITPTTSHREFLRIGHVTVSPPQTGDEWTLRDLQKYYRAAQEYVKRVGVIGGAIVFHPFRLSKTPDGDKMTWKEVLKRDDWKEFVVWSPHFHILALYWEIDGNAVNDVYNRTGWIIKRIRDVRKPDQTLKLMKYLLSHVGVDENIREKTATKWQNIRYFGVVANNQVNPRVWREYHNLVQLCARFFDEPQEGGESKKDICTNCGSEDIAPTFSREAYARLQSRQWVEGVEFGKFTSIMYNWMFSPVRRPSHSESEMCYHIYRTLQEDGDRAAVRRYMLKVEEEDSGRYLSMLDDIDRSRGSEGETVTAFNPCGEPSVFRRRRGVADYDEYAKYV